MTEHETAKPPLKEDRVKNVIVLVNENEVRLASKVQTGQKIKTTAIEQGVPIQLDFVLSLERGGGKTELVPDDKEIKVKNGDRFLAIPNDDNS